MKTELRTKNQVALWMALVRGDKVGLSEEALVERSGLDLPALLDLLRPLEEGKILKSSLQQTGEGRTTQRTYRLTEEFKIYAVSSADDDS